MEKKIRFLITTDGSKASKDAFLVFLVFLANF